MEQNKTGKYLKYAIGEIVLVMIGILLALQVNNWNEERKHEKIELQLLTSLRNDVAADIEFLETEDSIYLNIKSNAKKVIDLFYRARSAKDFIEIESDAFIWQKWSYLTINKIAYSEILNTGNFFTIKNKELKNLISEHYILVDKWQSIVSSLIQSQQDMMGKNSDLFAYKMLRNQLHNPQVDIELIDTSWINNPKSATYLALNSYLQTNLDMYFYFKLISIELVMISSKQLKEALNEELEKRKYLK